MNTPLQSVRINTATTTVVKGSGAELHRVVVNKAVANGNITVINGTLATHEVKAQIISPATLLQNHFCQDYGGMECESGLTIVTTGVQDVTVVYR